MGLYIVGEECTRLVALGKVFDTTVAIHNVPYTDDVVRVSVVTFYDGDARVPFPMSEIQYAREADSHPNVPKSVGSVERCNTGAVEDPLGELMKILYDMYQKPIQLPWDGTKFGLPNVQASFFITHVDVAEIISGDKFMDGCGRSRGHGSVYVLLEPQSIHNAKDRRQ
ncbi:hypothetical protein GmHk_11G033498 [Glycine max]|nr:hypothetical protein GmHk_11G033498 [Glycine max]